MTLERMNEDYKQAMRDRDEDRLAVLRMIRTGIKNAEVAARKPLDEDGVLRVIQKEMRERQDSLDEFRKANRMDLVEKEERQIAILQQYMPRQMGHDEIERAVREAMAETGAMKAADKGKLMGVLMPRLRGKADGREVNAVVTELLRD